MNQFWHVRMDIRSYDPSQKPTLCLCVCVCVDTVHSFYFVKSSIFATISLAAFVMGRFLFITFQHNPKSKCEWKWFISGLLFYFMCANKRNEHPTHWIDIYYTHTQTHPYEHSHCTMHRHSHVVFMNRFKSIASKCVI